MTAGSHTLKSHLSQIERIDEHIDHANRIARRKTSTG